MSVPANIVEGSSQESPREFARFLKIALNSTSELEYHLLVARDLHVVPAAEAMPLTDQVVEIRKMLHGLIRRVASRSAEPT